MALNGLKKFFNGEEEMENVATEDEYYNVDAEAAIKNIAGNGNKMVLLEPRAYSESQQIADHLKCRNSVVVNLKRVTPDQGKRIVDFLSGTVYAIGGDLQKLGTGIFLCTPKNINVEGKITEESDSEEKTEKKVKKQEKDFDFEW
ncbi:MAG: DUF552 domain-containing protein [Firmicutes bacterium]|nr:DUF552 domain-containing protein [Bacillota bacterium]